MEFINKYKKYIIGLSVLCILIIAVILLIPKQKDIIYSNDDIISVVYKDGIAKYIDGAFVSFKVKDKESAFKALESLKDKLNFKDASKEFELENITTNSDITYYKFNQKYKDILVYGSNIIISVSKDGTVLGMNGSYEADIDIDTLWKITTLKAKSIATKDLGDGALILSYDRYVYLFNEPKVVYNIVGYSNEKIGEYIIDALDGTILYFNPIADDAVYKYTGEGVDSTYEIDIEKNDSTLHQHQEYRFVDPIRNIYIVDGKNIGADVVGVAYAKMFSSSSPIVGYIDNGKFIYEDENTIKVAVTAMHNYQRIYDYYFNVLGRKSYDNKGSKVIINLNVKKDTFGKEEYQNTSWVKKLNQMIIGSYEGTSYVKSLDILAHEFTHGVINTTANFNNMGMDPDRPNEPGALNEAYADIIGTLIEDNNWTMNESIKTYRDLADPSKFKNPSEVGGEYYFPDAYLKGRTVEEFMKANDLNHITDYDNGAVHNNSTVVGHAAYLMYEQGAFKSKEEMAKVWYNSLFLLSSNATFEDCAYAVIKSASNLGLDKTSIYKIQKAFIDTKMLKPTKVKVEGIIDDGSKPLASVSVTLKGDENIQITTDKNGKFEIEVDAGTYELVLSKHKYKEYNKTINALGDTTVKVTLEGLIQKNTNTKNKNIPKVLNCTGNKCHKLTIYYMDGEDGLEENTQTYMVKDGTVIGVDVIVKAVNESLGSNMLESDGKTFYMNVGGFKVDFAWYYKGTDDKFDFTKPIKKDTELEVKVFNGIMDDDFIQNIYDMFN